MLKDNNYEWMDDEEEEDDDDENTEQTDTNEIQRIEHKWEQTLNIPKKTWKMEPQLWIISCFAKNNEGTIKCLK